MYEFSYAGVCVHAHKNKNTCISRNIHTRNSHTTLHTYIHTYIHTYTRFLKPLGRVKFLFASKVVVKTVAGAMASMGPVLGLVGFVVLLFGVAGVYLFGKVRYFHAF